MRIAMIGAGFAPGEASQLRRSMATFKRSARSKRFEKKFLEGHVRARLRRESSWRIAGSRSKALASYGFPESHAASFANLVYTSAWIKCHYPDVFLAALLNSQPMGFYATSQLVRDAQEHGVEVRPSM